MSINIIETDIEVVDQEFSIEYEKTISLLNIFAKNKNRNLIHVVGCFIDHFQYKYKTRYVSVLKRVGGFADKFRTETTDLLNKLKLTQNWAISTIANARTEEEINQACSDTVIGDLRDIIKAIPSRNLKDIQNSTKKRKGREFATVFGRRKMVTELNNKAPSKPQVWWGIYPFFSIFSLFHMHISPYI